MLVDRLVLASEAVDVCAAVVAVQIAETCDVGGAGVDDIGDELAREMWAAIQDIAQLTRERARSQT